MKERWREFTLAEIQPLVEESQRAFLPSKNNPDETVSDLLEVFATDPEFRIFGFEENSQPLSYVIALSDHGHSQSLAVGPMYVSKKHRGKRIGKNQIRHFIDYAKEMGYATVFTKTWGKNAASRATFERLGFDVESIKTGDRADGDDTISYLLHLAKENRS